MSSHYFFDLRPRLRNLDSPVARGASEDDFPAKILYHYVWDLVVLVEKSIRYFQILVAGQLFFPAKMVILVLELFFSNLVPLCLGCGSFGGKVNLVFSKIGCRPTFYYPPKWTSPREIRGELRAKKRSPGVGAQIRKHKGGHPGPQRIE